MAHAIGYLIRNALDGFDGTPARLSLKTAIRIAPRDVNSKGRQPDFQVTEAGEIEIGARWTREGKRGGKPFISRSIAAPALGSQSIHANVEPAAGKDDGEFVLLWNSSTQFRIFVAQAESARRHRDKPAPKYVGPTKPQIPANTRNQPQLAPNFPASLWSPAA